MNRDQYRAAYREARRATAFIIEFKAATGAHCDSAYRSLSACPSFTPTRLWGDLLGVGHPTWWHQSRMLELRRHPRLPA